MKKWRDVEGFFSEVEGLEIQKRATGKICVDLGTLKGRSAVCLAEVAEHVYTIDITFHPELVENIAGYPITYHTMTTKDASNLFEANSVDLVFEDTAHIYEIIKENILLWWSKIKLNGIMCFHDYGHPAYPNVKRIIHEFFGPVKEGNLVGGIAYVYKHKEALNWRSTGS